MCTDSIKSFSKSKYISKDAPSSFELSFPCGYCADCIRKKRSEWSLRSFYEAKSLFANNPNSFVLFDTLTYCDEDLRYFHDIYQPALFNCWDFPAFSRHDIDVFLDTLRKYLLRGVDKDIDFIFCHFGGYVKIKRHYKLPAYPGSVGHLRYFITCEYGTSDEYKGRKCTKRPHYHILFFVDFDIDPLIFSEFVSAAWPLGRTDGVLYKGRHYVLNERVIYNSKSCLRLYRYVSKYVSKDLYTYRKLYNRVFNSFSIHNPDWQNSYSKRLEFRRFKNQVLPFHRQSLGFGLSAIDFEDEDYIMQHNAIRMPISSAGVVASIPLPSYFRRKLFFNLFRVNGKLCWFPNQKYYLQQKIRFSKNVINLRNRIFSWNNSLGLETCTDIAKYQLLWRGKLVDKEHLSLSDHDFLRLCCSCGKRIYSLLNGSYYKNFNVERDSYTFHDDGFSHGRYVQDSNRFLSHREFLFRPFDGKIVVSSKTVPKFAGFDDILSDYNYYVSLLGKQADFDMMDKERQRDRYVQLGFLFF